MSLELSGCRLACFVGVRLLQAFLSLSSLSNIVRYLRLIDIVVALAQVNDVLVSELQAGVAVAVLGYM